MPELIKFAVTVRADDAPELYGILSQISYGRGRSEKLKMLATEYLQGRVRGFSVHDLRTLLSEGGGLEEVEEKVEEPKKETVNTPAGIAATRLCIGNLTSGFNLDSDFGASEGPDPVSANPPA